MILAMLKFLGITTIVSIAVCVVVAVCAALVRDAALSFMKERAMFYNVLQQREKDSQDQKRNAELKKAYQDLSAAKVSFMNDFREITKKHLDEIQTLIANSKRVGPTTPN